MPRGEAKLFECVECERKYSARDVQRRKYFPLTGVCRKCYRKMAAARPKIFCFGKVATKTSPGWSAQNEVCNKLCPDQSICLEFIKRHKGEEQSGTKEKSK